MTDQDFQQVRQNLAGAITQHRNMILRAQKLESLGLALFGVSLGLIGSLVVRRYFLHQIFHRLDLWTLFVGLFGVSVVIFVNYFLRKRIKLHRVAADAMEGVLNSQPGSNLRYHHHEQALKALDDIIALDQKFRFFRWKKKVE
jgi:uncharacterized membrane protein YeaQ/YmgE (transglycosylase-associated protein family)